MLRVFMMISLSVVAMATAPLGVSDYDGLGRVAWVTDGDTFRLESDERIRIARIDAPETHREQAKCAVEVQRGVRARRQVQALLGAREVSFHRVGRSYNRTVATVILDGEDLGTKLVRTGAATWWSRGRPKSDWCHQGH